MAINIDDTPRACLGRMPSVSRTLWFLYCFVTSIIATLARASVALPFPLDVAPSSSRRPRSPRLSSFPQCWTPTFRHHFFSISLAPDHSQQVVIGELPTHLADNHGGRILLTGAAEPFQPAAEVTYLWGSRRRWWSRAYSGIIITVGDTGHGASLLVNSKNASFACMEWVLVRVPYGGLARRRASHELHLSEYGTAGGLSSCPCGERAAGFSHGEVNRVRCVDSTTRTL